MSVTSSRCHVLHKTPNLVISRRGISHKEYQNEKHTERAEITGVAHSCCRRSLTTLGALEITVQRERTPFDVNICPIGRF